MADDKEGWKPEDEEEEDEVDENLSPSIPITSAYLMNLQDYRAQKDAVLFAIDVSESMLTLPPPSDSKKADKDSPVSAALKCAYQIMQQRIISNPNDMIGVLLFGTDQSKFQDEDQNNRGGLPYPHCYLLNDLGVPAASDVKDLKSIVEDEDEAKNFLVPTKESVVMANMLFCANQIFTTRAPNFGSRRLFIITDNDDPHSSDKSAKSAATVRAKDLYDLGVIIELFPISQPDHQFDRTKFYDDIIYRDPSEIDTTALGQTRLKAGGGDGIPLLAGLISDVNSKQVAKRALFSNMPFEIGPGFRISVKGYNILQKQVPARGCYVWLDGEEAQIATHETTKMAEDTAQKVEIVEIKKAYKFGGSQVLFSPEEQKELKNFGNPIIRIIGFKPQSMLPHWASMNKSTFIYPNEEDYVGSTRVFSALWQKLLKDKRMGLAWYIARTNATPLLVAILPSTEKIDESTNGQVIPAGLWLYPLPYADDIREPPETASPLVAPDNLVDDMRVVIQQLQLPRAEYGHSKYPNPALQWHYKILQAMALDEEIPETPEDKTIPKYRQIDKRAGEYAIKWGQNLHAQSEAAAKERSKHALKREADDDDDDGRGKKKVKVLDSLIGMSMDSLRALVDRGALNKSTVLELKEFCRSKRLSDVGKKADLVERIEQWVDTH